MGDNSLHHNDLKEKINSLTKKERLYFSIMRSRSGVLYLTSKPGVAKSAIGKSIADKLGYQYIDLRLSMVDETDLGLYPVVNEVEIDGERIKCLDFVVPRWAIEANKCPTIIHFEELNRTSQHVRNAALQILLERQIGTKFKFNENVLMMASGNLGEEDGTDVEEFDSALNNRLIHVTHNLTIDEWVDGFAANNVHKDIVSYIKSYPEQFYKYSENNKAYATPRSWTFLSDFIIANFGKNSTPKEYLDAVKDVAHCFIGPSSIKFIQYCTELISLNVWDVLNNYDENEEKIKSLNRSKKTEIIQNLKNINMLDLNENQLNNLYKFIKNVDDDEKTAFLLFILQKYDVVSFKNFLIRFKEELLHIRDINNEIL